MATLTWSAALELQVPAMDETHREFVDLLAAVEAAADTELTGLWHALTAHTEAHFGQEDRWMEATGFAVGNCHASQHQVVLEILREAGKRCAEGDYAMIRGLTPELAAWFNHHAQTMDAALAQHLQSVGFDTDSGMVAHAQALPPAPISGCGGACSTPAEAAPAVRAAA